MDFVHSSPFEEDNDLVAVAYDHCWSKNKDTLDVLVVMVVAVVRG